MAKPSSTLPRFTIQVQDTKTGWRKHGGTYRGRDAAVKKANELAQGATVLRVTISTPIMGLPHMVERIAGRASKALTVAE